METEEPQNKRRRGRKKLYTTLQEQHEALRARQARYQERRSQTGKNVHIFLPAPLYDKLVARAGALGVSRTEYVKTLIAEAVSR